MSKAVAGAEPTISSDDVTLKWRVVQASVRGEVERRVGGVSALTLGVVALGVGALGAAYYLGKRQSREVSVASVPPPETISNPAPAPGRRTFALLEPLLEQVLHVAATRLGDRLKS